MILPISIYRNSKTIIFVVDSNNYDQAAASLAEFEILCDNATLSHKPKLLVFNKNDDLIFTGESNTDRINFSFLDEEDESM